MKKKDILLDFTSLLDVTLIVIFFFVIFSHLDTEENREKTDAKVNELKESIEEAEERESEAEKLIKQLEDEISIVRDSDERQASNVEEMLQYGKSGNLKLILQVEEDGWFLRVVCKEELISEINFNKEKEDMAKELQNAIQLTEYTADDTIFCDLVFDASVPGTNKAYKIVAEGLEKIESTYTNLYCSKTDLAIGEE